MPDKPPLLPFRVGRHNERNIYRVDTLNEDRHSDRHIGCMFTPEDGLLVVAALNFTYGPVRTMRDTS